MKRIASFTSPRALAAIAVWLLVGVVAFVWSIPGFANIHEFGTPSVNWEASLGFAFGVASGVVALLAAIVLVVRRLPAATADP